MQQRPVPEYNMVKPKIRNRRAIANFYGCLLGLAMLFAGLAAGMLGTYIIAPLLYQWDLTEIAVWNNANRIGTQQANAASTQNAILLQTAGAQLLTADANRTQSAQNVRRATDIAMMLVGTEAALLNERNLLQGTATQSAQNIIATRTALAVDNARQMTQIALDYNATQAQLQQNATEVELSFQQTQAAINDNATAISDQNASSAQPELTADVESVAQIALPTETAILPTDTPEPAPDTATPTVTNTPSPEPTATATTAPSQTPVPTATQDPNIIDLEQWELSDDLDWSVEEDGLRAQVSGAWLLSRETYEGNYSLDLNFLPAFADSSEYLILLNTPEAGDGILLRLSAVGLQIRQVGLFLFPVTVLEEPQSLSLADLRALDTQQTDLRLTGENELTVQWQARQIVVSLNNNLLLSTRLPVSQPEGRAGVLLPNGVFMSRFTIETAEATSTP